jgi:hypothetical protein
MLVKACTTNIVHGYGISTLLYLDVKKQSTSRLDAPSVNVCSSPQKFPLHPSETFFVACRIPVAMLIHPTHSINNY